MTTCSSHPTCIALLRCMRDDPRCGAVGADTTAGGPAVQVVCLVHGTCGIHPQHVRPPPRPLCHRRLASQRAHTGVSFPICCMYVCDVFCVQIYVCGMCKVVCACVRNIAGWYSTVVVYCVYLFRTTIIKEFSKDYARAIDAHSTVAFG